MCKNQFGFPSLCNEVVLIGTQNVATQTHRPFMFPLSTHRTLELIVCINNILHFQGSHFVIMQECQNIFASTCFEIDK